MRIFSLKYFIFLKLDFNIGANNRSQLKTLEKDYHVNGIERAKLKHKYNNSLK
jgi:hypothetical protein